MKLQKSVCANSDIKLILDYQEAVVVDDLEIEVIMEEFELGSIGNSRACSRESLRACSFLDLYLGFEFVMIRVGR